MLRKDLGPVAATRLHARDETLAIEIAPSDVDALEVLAASDGDDVDRLRRAADLCRGELLADISLRDESFEDWLSAERARFKEVAIQLFQRLFTHEIGPARIMAAQRLLALDELRESSHRLLMTAYAESGENGLALKQYERCRTVLREELQVEPGQQTRDLRRDIAAGTIGPKIAPEPVLALPDRQSIAVLPFDNASPEPDQAFFADGISEELIANLSRFRRLFVIARASSFAFRGKSTSTREIGRHLGVRFLLQGRVRRAGSSLRVAAELVEAESGSVLWVERYDRQIGDLFALIDELSATIVASTVGHLEEEMLRQSRRKPTERLDAYEYMLRGRVLMHSLRREDKLAAKAMFEQAVAIDANFAMAQAQLAYVHLYEFFWDNSGKALDRAAEIASGALAVDEDEAWCHMVLGLTFLHRRQFDLALTHCERAVAINPNDPELSAKLGLVLTDLGRPSEAIPLIEKAMRLSPLNPEAYGDYLALALFGARRYRDAIAALNTAPQDTFYYHAWLAACHVRLGDVSAARRHGARATELAPDFTISQYEAMEPIRDPADMADWTDAFRQAGIPG